MYLMDGDASGRWQAGLSNWNARAYRIPKERLKDCCTDLPEMPGIDTPGVYFLFGHDDASDREFIYVGEAENVLKRLEQPHTFERGDDGDWTEAIVFVTTDGTLEKGRVRYLENRFYTIAKDAGKYVVKNANTPSQSPVSGQIRALLEGFITNVCLMMSVLGYKAFELPDKQNSQSKNVPADLLYFYRNHGDGGRATGKLVSDRKLWVFKGSYICPEVAPYCPPNVRKLREQNADAIDAHGILQRNLIFDSPSSASTFVCGKSSNGFLDWKNKDGVTLKALMDMNSSLHVSDDVRAD